MRSTLALLAALVALATVLMVPTAAIARQEQRVSVSVAPSKPSVAPGETLAIAVIFDHQPGWHIHTNAPVLTPAMVKDHFTPIETTIVAGTPAGVLVWPVQWPTPTKTRVVVLKEFGPEMYGVFAGHAVAYIPIQIPADAQPGATIELPIAIGFQACDETNCEGPQDVSETVKLPVVAAAVAGTAGTDFAGFDPSVFAQQPGAIAPGIKPGTAPAAKSKLIDFQLFGLKFSLDPTGALGLILLLLVAALGGLLLNFTPCVLPVIPIKIMGLSQAAGNPARCLYLGSIMSLGVVAFWIAIGAAIASISGFTAISSLFQTPWFSLLVGVFILIMATGMLGAFAVRLPQAVYMVNPSHDTAAGSFGFGIMTAVLSTPCTAPFMGSAAAWAATQNAAITLVTFGAIGAGMAIPYLVLSAAPRLVSKMPRTGPASELVKQVMGILMLAVAAFFLGLGIVALIPGGPPWLRLSYWWIVAALAIAASAWLVVRTFQITKAPGRRAFFTLAGSIFAFISVVACYHFALPSTAIPWQNYSHQLYASKIAEHKVVVLDFTADWCLSCKTIEAAVLERADVIRALNAPDVVPIRVDLTARQAEGWAKLKGFNEVGIPLLVVMTAASDEPVFKSNAYTPEQVIDAVSQGRVALKSVPQPLAAH